MKKVFLMIAVIAVGMSSCRQLIKEAAVDMATGAAKEAAKEHAYEEADKDFQQQTDSLQYSDSSDPSRQ